MFQPRKREAELLNAIADMHEHLYQGGSVCMHDALRSLASREVKEEREDFMECATCSAKSGSPTLCSACLHNRSLVAKLSSREVKEEREKPRIGQEYFYPSYRNGLWYTVSVLWTDKPTDLATWEAGDVYLDSADCEKRIEELKEMMK